SLGVVLYVLLIGGTPFDPEGGQKQGIEELLRRIRDEEPTKPSARLGRFSTARASLVAEERGTDPASLRKQLTGDLDWIVLQALEKDPGRRYASASELAADLGRHLLDEPVLAGPPSTA